MPGNHLISMAQQQQQQQQQSPSPVAPSIGANTGNTAIGSTTAIGSNLGPVQGNIGASAASMAGVPLSYFNNDMNFQQHGTSHHLLKIDHILKAKKI